MGTEANPASPALDATVEVRRDAPLRRKVRRWWRTLKHEKSSPEQLGAAVALGVFVGCSPFYGIQILLCFLLAALLRLNKIAVLLGVQITAPPTMPFFMFGSLQLGAWMVSGRWVPLSFDALRTTPLVSLVGRFAIFFAVGAFAIGALLAPIFGWLTVLLVRRYRRRKVLEPVLSDDEEEAFLDRLEALPARFRCYATWKAQLDPIYPMVLSHLVGRREVVDLGGGMGLLEALLSRRSPQTRLHLVEWDARKVEMARRMLGDLPTLTIEQGDARETTLGAPDAVVMLDVLHYSDVPRQQEWLERCAAAVAPGGVLILRELDSGAKRKGLAEHLDGLAVRLGWNHGAGVASWPIREIVQALERAGFTCRVTPAGRGPFKANTLVIARKRA